MTRLEPEVIADLRRSAVLDCVGRVRELTRDGVERSTLEAVKGELLCLAARTELFPVDEFASIAAGTSALYRLFEDHDHRYGLYVACPAAGRSTAPHDHTTWAVIAGVRGREHNRLYRRTAVSGKPVSIGIEQIGELDVVPGVALALMPDDIHSIHLGDDGPHINLHLYGLGVEHTHGRTAFDLQTGATRTFVAATGVRLARGGV